ncbi:MAG: hypothetical protein Q7S57_01105 [bacterium]|nr:hypothetical protein [bacterium]
MSPIDSLSGQEEPNEEEIGAREEEERQKRNRSELRNFALRQGTQQIKQGLAKSAATEAGSATTQVAGQAAKTVASSAVKTAGSQLVQTAGRALVSATLQVLAYVGAASLPVIFVILLIILCVIIMIILIVYYQQNWDYYVGGYSKLFQDITNNPATTANEIIQGTWINIKSYFGY